MSEYRIISTLGHKIDYKRISFSDGTHNIEILTPVEELRSCDHVTITVPANLTGGFDRVAWDLRVIVNALNYCYTGIKVSLLFEYLPHARADRHFTSGSACPLKCFIQQINSMGFNTVYVCAPHNAEALPGSWKVSEDYIYNDLIRMSTPEVLVFPDTGAAKRFKKYVKPNQPLVVMEKTRDLSSGQVNGMKVSSDYGVNHNTRRMVILDDICDGGKTFTECAKAIKAKWPDRKVYLAIAHGIFSKGLSPFEGLIDGIYSYNIVGEYVSKEDILAYNANPKVKSGE